MNRMNLISVMLTAFVVSVTGVAAKNNYHNRSLSDALFGFENLQDSTRTKVWWFHGETETTKEGITADLEAFRSAGVGGVVYYDQSHGKATDALPGFTDEWWDMLEFSSKEAKRLGLSFEIHVSNGFVAGGPWIDYQNAMKRLCANEMIVDGGKYFEGKIAPPASRYNYHEDVSVIAVPIDCNHSISRFEKFQINSNVVDIAIDNIFDASSTTLTRIPVRKNGSVYINMKFDDDFTARSISYELRPQGKATTSATNAPAPPADTFVGTGYRILPVIGQLEASDDGVNYRKICDLQPIYRAHESWRQKTISFEAVKSKYYRLNLHDWWDDLMGNKDLQIGKVQLSSFAKVDCWEEKAGLYAEYIDNENTPQYNKKEVFDSQKMIDLTALTDSDGTLRWNAPKGKWLIMRLSAVATGAKTKHGRSNLLGLECDKLSRDAVILHWLNYPHKIMSELKERGCDNISGIAMDSHEAGAQNWTSGFLDEFLRRQGYDMTRYLPVMAGYVVDGVKESTGFLFDVRRNIADMISDNYYGTLDSLSNASGVTLTAQAIGNALCIAGDPIQAKSKVKKPQGEFWGIHPDGNYDIKESSSSAHLYGKQIASAEAYTDIKYSASLADLKSLADYAYAFGINEFVVCASAYQPWTDRFPGSTGGGRHYAINRNNTWWDYSRPFWDYQSRNAYIMRQGVSSSALCVYLGENAPVKILTYRLPDIPGGFDFDAFSSDALFTRMDAIRDKIVLPDGVSYEMMILPRSGDITLSALRKIFVMVNKGAKVYGPRPESSGSAKDIEYQNEYNTIVRNMWGNKRTATGVNKCGDGYVYWGMPLEQALTGAGISPDIELSKGNTKNNKIYFKHRSLQDAEVYFLDNHKDEAESNIFTFRGKGQYVQLWNTTTRERFNVPVMKQNENSVTVDLCMAPRESFFIILTDNQDKLLTLKANNMPVAQDISTQWSVNFDTALGGCGDVNYARLTDWTMSEDERVKYYSGSALYTKLVSIEKSDKSVILELDTPGAARIMVNSQEAGIVWCSPWQVDITDYLKTGENILQIQVCNSLTNRMICDLGLPQENRVTYSYPVIVKEGDSLIPSGLTGARLIFK